MNTNLPVATGCLRDLQLRMVEMLTVLDAICRKHNIRYWLAYGTLLGAVRHQGFIPWDDDMDVFVHEDDFDKLAQLLQKELPDDLFLQNNHTDPSSLTDVGFMRLRDNRSLMIMSSEDFTRPYNKGIVLDIFAAKRCHQMNKWQKYLFHRISFAYGFFQYRRQVNMKNMICYFAYPLSYVFHKCLLAIYSSLVAKDHFGTTPEHYVYGNFFPENEIFPLRDIEFEGKKFLAPANPDAFLKHIYGDYWQIPDPSKRRTHTLYVFMDKAGGVVSY